MISQSDLFDVLPARPALTVTPAPRVPGVTFSIWADITCGEACWHAREEVCRCSCGGRNHGCLRNAGGERPVRTAKIDGERYELLAVGARREVIDQAGEINGAQFRSIESPSLIIDGTGKQWSEAEIADAKARGAELWWNQYSYSWSETDAGAPARMKYATPAQAEKWEELRGYRGDRNVCLLWKRVQMPTAPTIQRVNRDGTPHPVQCPNDKPKA